MPTEFRAFKVSGATFEIDKKYVVLRPIGNGAYGVVISALDTSKNVKVAIKKIPRAFEDLVDGKRILREIKLLRHFKHENIISICDIFPPPTYMKHELNDVYIVSDLMETDLHRIIYSRQPLTLDHVQYFIYQVLRALKYMHSAKVIHRDLKPSNLLCNSNCELKICDLGLARGMKSEEEEKNIELTEYVVTRWYRAPEIMLACQEYTLAIDVWSAGCIFAELLQRRPLFPGEDYVDQIRMICEKLGKPKPEELDFVTSEKARKFIMSLPETENNLATMFPQTTKEALDLLSKMLVFNPAKRITVEEALHHPFMASLQEDEPVADFEFNFDFENEQLTKQKLQEHMWSEILHFHPYAEEYSQQLQATGQKAPPVDRPSPGPSPRSAGPSVLHPMAAAAGSLNQASMMGQALHANAVAAHHAAAMGQAQAQVQAQAQAHHGLLAAAASIAQAQGAKPGEGMPATKPGARSSDALEDAETPIVKRARPGDNRPAPATVALNAGTSDTANESTSPKGQLGAQLNSNDIRMLALAKEAAAKQQQHEENLKGDVKVQASPELTASLMAQLQGANSLDPRMGGAVYPADLAFYTARGAAGIKPGSNGSTPGSGDLGMVYAMRAQQLQAQAAQMQLHAQAAAMHAHSHAHKGSLGAVMGHGMFPLHPPGGLFGGMAAAAARPGSAGPGSGEQGTQDAATAAGGNTNPNATLKEMLEGQRSPPLSSGAGGPTPGVGVNMNAQRLLGSMVLGPGMHGGSRLGASLGVNLGTQLGPRFSSATNPFSTTNMNKPSMNPFARSAMSSNTTNPITETKPEVKNDSPTHSTSDTNATAAEEASVSDAPKDSSVTIVR